MTVADHVIKSLHITKLIPQITNVNRLLLTNINTGICPGATLLISTLSLS